MFCKTKTKFHMTDVINIHICDTISPKYQPIDISVGSRIKHLESASQSSDSWCYFLFLNTDTSDFWKKWGFFSSCVTTNLLLFVINADLWVDSRFNMPTCHCGENSKQNFSGLVPSGEMLYLGHILCNWHKCGTRYYFMGILLFTMRFAHVASW